MFEQQVNQVLGISGRMLSHSKVGYCKSHPDNQVVFNANVCTASDKLWYGDIDITIEQHKLQQLADMIGERVYVLKEQDARFVPQLTAALIDKAVFSVG